MAKRIKSPKKSIPFSCDRCKRETCICGRPPVVTPEVLLKLEQAFSLGASDNEATAYAEISTSTLYDYQNDHPEFVERKEQLKDKPLLKARDSVIRHMETDGNLALKYLERKKKNEFAVKVINVGAHVVATTKADLSDEEKAKLKEVLNDTGLE